MANLIAAATTVPLEVSPYAVGGGALLILVLLVLTVLVIGAGREHS